MQKLPQHDRLRAGLTCSAWRTAANAATAKIKCRRLDDQRFSQLTQWLQRWGQQLGSLRMVLHQKQQLQQLPCSTLSMLVVRGGELQPPVLLPPPAFTLTKLVLENTSFLISAQQQSLVLRQELSRLTSLRHLALCISGWQQAAANDGPWQYLMPLQDLTELRLGAGCGAGMMPGLGKNISRLSTLQVLDIEDTVRPSPSQEDQLSNLQHLQRLRKLHLCGNGNYRIIQDSSTGSGSPTGLSCLELRDCFFNVAAVSAITGLRSLSLKHVLCLDGATGEFYAWLPRLQQLTCLCLGGVNVMPTDIPAGPDRTAAYRALTGSNFLQKLDLQDAFIPRYAWQHVFPADKQMMQLTYLKLHRGHPHNPGGMLAAIVQGIVRCCPSLQALDGGRHLPLLQDLTTLCHLTSLVAWRPGDAAAADTLSMLTALQQLELHGSSDCQQHDFAPILQLSLLTDLSLPESGWQRQQKVPPSPAQGFVCDTLSQLTSLVKLNTTAFALTDGQLQQLTALTGLSSLVIKLDRFSEQLKARLQDLGNYQTYRCFLTSKAPRGTPHDIYLQLRRCFETATEVELHDDEQHRQPPQFEPPSHPPDDSAEQPAPALSPAGH